MTDAVPVQLPKIDPETLVIRAKPGRAIRFRRGVIIGIAALCSVSLMTVAWVALKPQVFQHVTSQEELSQPNARAGADALNGVPATYGDAPKLGPPLPGDLGRPILAHQRAMAVETAPVAVDTGGRVAQAAEAERERRASELKAARESGILVQASNGAPAPAEAPVPSTYTVPQTTGPAESGRVAIDTGRDPNAQQRKIDFVGAVDPRGDVNPHHLVAAPSPYVLSAGSVISASLITGLRSDLPGLVTAQVTERVYDSPTGHILLIPQGARLVGSYDNVVAFGQKRALIVWQRIMLPDGSSLRIENVPATDASGYAGVEDMVDFHTWTLLKGVALSTVVGVGFEMAFTGDSDLVQALRRSTQDNVSRSGDQITQRNLNIQPTITVRPGARVRLVVHRDLILAPWRPREH